jgi:arylsulfatase A
MNTHLHPKPSAPKNLLAYVLHKLATYVFIASPVLLTLCAVNSGRCDEKKSPPNIVLILADDLGYGELGCYGQTKIRTPNIDRLAKEGMRFTQHYSGAPVCAPSRCTLMTGLHSGHAEIRGNLQASKSDPKFTEGQHPISAGAVTIAELMRQQGYTTGAMGKWGLGPVGSSGAPHEQGFDLFFGYNCQAVAHSYFPSHLWRNGEKIALNAKPIPGHAKQPEGEISMSDWQGDSYASTSVLKTAVEFIREKREQPFFLYLPFIEPHVAMQPPPQLVESYPQAWDDRPYRGQCGYLPHPRPRAGYAAMITSLDEHVGTILRTLEECRLTENTLVLFTSDNGTTHEASGDKSFGVGGVDADFFNSTAGLKGKKGSVHEGGLRVPLVVRWPGHIAAGSVSHRPCYFPDYFPTLCEILGVQPTTKLDGESFLPALRGIASTTREKPMVWVFPEYSGQVAVRMNQWKVVRKNLQRPKQPSDWEVYHVEHDAREEQNIATQQPEIVAQAIAILKREVAENATFPLKIPGVNE